MKKFILAALLSSAVATPAFAQDPASDAAFTGPRVEIIAGGDLLEADGSADAETDFVYGLGAGFDFAFGGVVAGVEGEISDSRIKDCESNLFEDGDRLCGGIGQDLYVGGRVGVVAEGNLLLYAKAGYTRVKFDADYDVSDDSDLDEDEIDELLDDEDFGDLDGVRIGAGIEASFMTQGFAKLEYRYSNYEADVTRHQIVAGIGIRF